MTPQEFAQLFRLPPAEAVKFMESKGIKVTFDWRDMWQDEHRRAFTISRLTSPDILQAIQDRLVKSVDGELSRKDWTKQVRELLQNDGWWGTIPVEDQISGEVVKTRFDSNRLRLIFDVNTRTASAAGQWERFEKSKRAMPYLRYVTKRDEKVREQHRSWNNLVLPVDHPFWDTHAPPNGWRCRCTLTAMSQKDYDKGVSPRGEPLNKAEPKIEMREWYNQRTGKTEQVPVGIDPGWAYNPGKPAMRDAALKKTVEDKLAKLSPVLAELARKDLATFMRKAIAMMPNADVVFAKAVREGYESLPDHWRKAVDDAGYQVVVTRRLTEALPRLVGTTPRGSVHGTSWDVRDGMTSDEKFILVAQESLINGKPVPVSADRGRGVLFHEFGHVMDGLIGLSLNKDVIKAWRVEAARLKEMTFKDPYAQFDQDYFTLSEPYGIYETVAELFSRLHGGRTAESLDALTYFPETAKVLRSILYKDNQP